MNESLSPSQAIFPLSQAQPSGPVHLREVSGSNFPDFAGTNLLPEFSPSYSYILTILGEIAAEITGLPDVSEKPDRIQTIGYGHFPGARYR